MCDTHIYTQTHTHSYENIKLAARGRFVFFTRRYIAARSALNENNQMR